MPFSTDLASPRITYVTVYTAEVIRGKRLGWCSDQYSRSLMRNAFSNRSPSSAHHLGFQMQCPSLSELSPLAGVQLHTRALEYATPFQWILHRLRIT